MLVNNMEEKKSFIIKSYEEFNSINNQTDKFGLSVYNQKKYIHHHMLIEQDNISGAFEELNKIEKTISDMSYSAYARAISDIPYCREEILKILKEASLYNFNNPENIPTIFSLIRTVFVMPDKKKEYFFDEKNKSLGVVIYGDGTLKLFFNKKNIGEFLYAKKGEDGGMITSRGIFNITKYINNSHNIKKLFGFVK